MPRRRFIPLALVAILAVYSLSLLVYALAKTRIPPAKSALPKLASLSQPSSIRTVSNNLTRNLGDGRELMSAFDGPPHLRAALEQNQARSLSLASADFDEDGVPDLITGYEVLDRGAFSLMRGNIDSIYPNQPEAKNRLASGRFTHAPFLSPALLFESPAPVDFAGAGDFDGDSHWDVVVASRSKNSLYLFPGDGKGGFASARETKLPGVITALVTGEINRSDGLTDVVVSINGPDGPAVLVFEGPEGALRSEPENIRLTRSASALVLAQLTDSYEIDLAVAEGNELQIVLGRDRKLSLDKQQQADVLPLEIRSRFFPQTIKAISAGDFSASSNSDLAVLLNDGELQLLVNPNPHTVTEAKSSRTTTHISRWKSLPSIKHWPRATSLTRVRVSGKPGDDVAITDGYAKALEIWNVAEDGNTSGDVVPNALPQEQTLVPLSVLPMRLNADGLNDLVMISPATTLPGVAMTDATSFSTGETGSNTISLTSPTPTPIPTPTPTPEPQPKTFVVNSPADTDDGACNVTNCTLREAINASNANPGADTITFSIGSGVQTISPLSALPSITETASLDATTQPGFAGQPIIELSGALAGSSNGLSVRAPNCVVRGFVINRFSGVVPTTGNGIRVVGAGNAIIQGNYIGIDISGSTVLANSTGVTMEGPSNSNTVGGTVSAARNVISGNGSGIRMIVGLGRNDQSVIAGNYIGTDATGSVALGNGSGLSISDSATVTTIGGTAFGSRNVISGNQGNNIHVRNAELGIRGILILGNLIGTDVTGSTRLGGIIGVSIDGSSLSSQTIVGTTIGGTTDVARNVVSGNDEGIELSFEEVRVTRIQGNYIGTDVSGSHAIGNRSGILFQSGPANNTIGGSTSGARNVISGNTGAAIVIQASFGQDNFVQGNFIGTDFTGTNKLGNGSGVSAAIQSIGPSSVGIRDNVISNNGGTGVSVRVDCISCAGQLSGSLISNNHIGTDLSNQINMGNGSDGILLEARASSNTITQNAIAFNHQNGVNIPGSGPNAAVNNLVESNSIFANSGLGINLGDPGITANDFQDPDQGGNTLQNFPLLTSTSAIPAESNLRVISESSDNPTPAASTITVSGTLNSTPNSKFIIQWTFTSDTQCVNNQPQTPALLFGKVPDVTTNANGDASYNFDFDFPPGIKAGLIYANATNSTNNTSEYSGCFPIRAAVPVTIETNPIGRSFSVDGGSLVSSTQVLNWIPGSTHTIATTSIQAGTTGQQFVWNNWSDAGALSHSVTAPNSGITYIANFTTQYMLTMNAGSGGSTSPPQGFFNSGQIVQISASPNNGFSFTGWTGLGSGSFSGTTNPASVTMNGPITQTAAFTQTVVQTPLGQNVSVTLNGVTVTFAVVTVAGTTTITPITPAGQLPNSYQLTGAAFDISTTAVVQQPLTVCFNVPSITDETAFSQLRILHQENGNLVERTASHDFSAKMLCANVNSLSPFVLASTAVPLWQLLLETDGRYHAAALEAGLFVRDPFPVINLSHWLNPESDRNTRVLVFLRNLPPEAGAVTVNLVDTNNQSYDIAAENVSTLGPVADFSQIRFRLPNTLAPGACTIQIRAQGKVSNSGFIQIRP